MYLSWCILWSLTNYIYENCQKFTNKGGLDLFLHSKLRSFNSSVEKKHLILSMLGPILNTSEFTDLRLEIRKKIYFLNEILVLTDFKLDEFDINYMATGIIAQLEFDGLISRNFEEIGIIKGAQSSFDPKKYHAPLYSLTFAYTHLLNQY